MFSIPREAPPFPWQTPSFQTKALGKAVREAGHSTVFPQDSLSQSSLFTMPGTSLKRAGSLEQAASFPAPQQEAQGSPCQEQAQMMNRNTTRRRIKPASLRKSQKTIWGREPSLLGPWAKGIAELSFFPSSPEERKDQQWLLWPFGASWFTGNKH